MTGSSSTPTPAARPSGFVGDCARAGSPARPRGRLPGPPDPAADAAAVETSLDALAAFSPGISGPPDAADAAFGTLEVQLDGLEAFWGPEPDPRRQGPGRPQPLLPGMPRAGIAGTRFVAALPPPRIPVPQSSRRPRPAGRGCRLPRPLPGGALTRDPEVRGRLARFGLATIGRWPPCRARRWRPLRTGEGSRLHARATAARPTRSALARAPERLGPRVRPRRAGRRSRGAPLRPSPPRPALGAQLDARGEAAGRARLARRSTRPSPPGRFRPPARSSRPSRSPSASRSRPPTRRRSSDSSLTVSNGSLRRCPLPAWSSSCSTRSRDGTPTRALHAPGNAPRARRWQLARLAVRFGEERVGRVALADPEAPLPESRWTWHPVAADGRPAGEARARSTGRPARSGHARTHPGHVSGARLHGARMPVTPARDPPPSRAPPDRGRARPRRPPRCDRLGRPPRAVEVCTGWRVEEAWWGRPSPATTSRWWGRAGSPLSISTGSTGPGTWSASTTDHARDPVRSGRRPALRSGGLRGSRTRSDEDEHQRHEDNRQQGCPEPVAGRGSHDGRSSEVRAWRNRRHSRRSGSGRCRAA